MDVEESFEGWAIVELMGHRRLAGHVSEAEMFGTVMLRLDVPGPGGIDATQFYASAALYCVTPTTEEIARSMALTSRPEPVTRWELERAQYEAENDEADPGEPEMTTFEIEP